MSTDRNVVSKKSWKRGAAVGTGIALIAGAFAAQPGSSTVTASSHREAPLIAGDPRADNTDVYAFTSPDDASSVTLISDWIPFEEPNGGPNFYTWADDTRYNIKVDNNGDALADLTYTWVFSTVVRDGSRDFLSNLGPVTSLDDADLNVYQTYDLTVTDGAGVTTVLAGDGDGLHSAGDPIAAPSIAGSASMPDYTPLRNQAIKPLNGGGKTYVGQSDDPFFLDLRVFDLLYGGDASKVGQDTLAGYNVNQVALQLPKTALALNGNAGTNPVIGIWSTTDERKTGAAGDLDPANFVQVSRLGNPLVNEVVIPLALKDAFNSIRPDQDHTIAAAVDAVQNPRLPELVQAIYKVPAPATPRNDLTEIFLQGISKANAGLSGDPSVVLPVDLNSLGLNADVEPTAVVPSEMLRLNMSVPVNPNPNRYGVLAGDVQGFPNGRRLTDDVVDIAVQAVEGAAQTGQLVKGLLTIDSVDRNDRPFTATFPYTALPHVQSVNTGTERTPRAPEVVSINPTRVLETRTSEPSGQIGFAGSRPVAGQEVHVKVTGPGLAPDDASAVLLNVTATNTAADGFVTVYPCGTPRPATSNFNPLVGKITHNLVISKVGTNGEVCMYTYEATDLIADLSGFHPSGSAYAPATGERLLETRTGQPGGQRGWAGPTKPAAGSTIELQVTGTAGANLPADTKAVFLNVTTVNSDSAGWLVAYPCGTPRPTSASNVNQIPGLVRANLVAAKVGANGKVCLYTYSSTDIVVDLMGSAPMASTFVATNPERVLETRVSEGQINYTAARPIAGQTIEVKVVGFGTTNIPADAGTVLLNVTAADPANAGVVTVFPCGSPVPLASNINLQGITVPNLVSVKVGDGGRVCVHTTGATDLIADILGYYPGTVLV
ncbi:MAG: hypothetical protein JWM12_3067 [Ilumatobacteraceae bacterium]|nr:hypothetical protein [Ilumatobacteraceae bacterium]